MYPPGGGPAFPPGPAYPPAAGYPPAGGVPPGGYGGPPPPAAGYPQPGGYGAPPPAGKLMFCIALMFGSYSWDQSEMLEPPEFCQI